MQTAEKSFTSPHPSMTRYLRPISPVCIRAAILGERLRNFQFELLDAQSYVKLERIVSLMEKFFDEGQEKQ